MFKFFLVDEHGQVGDPAGLVTAVPNWTVGETFLLGRGEKFRILEIRTGLVPDARRRVQRRLRRRAGLIYKLITRLIYRRITQR